MPDNYELFEARALRDAGIDAVDAAGLAPHKKWRPEAEAALAQLIREGKPFTADDLRRRVESSPENPNQVGALIALSARRNEIRKLGSRQSGVKSRRAGSLHVWQAQNPAA